MATIWSKLRKMVNRRRKSKEYKEMLDILHEAGNKAIRDMNDTCKEIEKIKR